MTDDQQHGYEQVYQRVKQAGADLQPLLAQDWAATPEPGELRMLCEMILVRELDDWYSGEPGANISQAIHRYCARRRPTGPSWRQAGPAGLAEPLLRRAAGLLAWAYARLGEPSDDAFLLAAHVLEDLATEDAAERTLGQQPAGELAETFAGWQADRHVPERLRELTPERRAIWLEILRWELEPLSSLDGARESLGRSLARLDQRVPERVRQALFEAMQRALQVSIDAAQHLVREEALLGEVRGRGHPAASLGELRRVPIEELDEIALASMRWGQGWSALQGLGLGFLGLPGLIVDVAALTTLSFRYMGQVAATYGFPADSEAERHFLLHVLGATSETHATRSAFLRKVNRLAGQLAHRKSWKELNQHTVMKLLRTLAAIIGVRLTKKKLAQALPLLGAGVGAAASYGFVRDNLQAARMLYRKRWLLEHCLGAPRQ